MVGVLLALLLSAAPVVAGDDRPNIVVIVSDDMGAQQPGFRGGRSDVTPHLDQLAQGGAQLNQFYVHATCTPTRAAFMTGRYPFRTGTEERFHANDVAGMLSDERTIAEALRDAGYFTAIVGKWHLGEWQKKHLPLARGFQHQYGSYGAVIDSFTHYRGDVYDWHRNELPLREEGYSTFLIADEFDRVVEAHLGNRPLFVYVAFNAVHVPHSAPREYLDKFNGDVQLAMLACLDEAVGRMIDSLASRGAIDNTLIIYFNDNGGPKRIGNGPWRGVKKTTYEGGVRVPCVWSFPGKIAAGSVVDGIAHVTDLYPTLVKQAGGALDQPWPLDGLDIWPAISGAAPSPRSEVVLSVPGLEDSETGPPAIRQGNYKWMAGELYDLSKDPYETHDLAANLPEIAGRLAARLDELSRERRTPQRHGKVPGARPLIKGEEENRDPPDWLTNSPQPPEQPRRKQRKRDRLDD